MARYAQSTVTPPPSAPLFFADASEFRAWLQRHAGTAVSLLVGFHKVGSGRPSMSWPQSVDEALCVGWIDGVRRRVDDERYTIRFTPRRPGSIWSKVNIARVEALIAAGRMQPAGLAAFARRTERRSGIYSFEQEQAASLSPDEIRTFKRDRAAWAYFEAAPPGYRKRMLHWVTSAKQAATRERRLARLIESCAAGLRL